MQTEVQKNVLGQKETLFARTAEHALEKEMQGFSESPQFTLCCFFTNAKMLIRFNTEMQHRPSKPEIAKYSWREVKTAALLHIGKLRLVQRHGKRSSDKQVKEQDMSPLGSSESCPNLFLMLCLHHGSLL